MAQPGAKDGLYYTYHDQAVAAWTELAEVLAIREPRHADDGAVDDQLSGVAEAFDPSHGRLLDGTCFRVEEAQDRIPFLLLLRCRCRCR